MNINNTGTFYVEGEYAQGDTILKAGDWELRANGSKNAFAYSPDTFVRRNLLNWSEDFSQAGWSAGSAASEITGTYLPLNSKINRVFNNSGTFRHKLQTVSVTGDAVFTFYAKRDNHDVFWIRTRGIMDGSLRDMYHSYNFATNTIGTASGGTTAITRDTEILAEGWVRFTFNLPNCEGDTLVGFYTSMGNDQSGSVLITAPQLEQAATPSDYQRTTTHVPRPFAIKDELVTNGTFDTDISGWANFSTVGIQWSSGEIQITTQSAGASGAQSFQMPLVAGKTYTVSGDLRIGTGANMQLAILNPSSSTILALGETITSTTTQKTELSFICTDVNSRVYIRCSGAAGTYFADNISVKEVQQPLTLGNGNHKDFRYYPKKLSQNETEALTA